MGSNNYRNLHDYIIHYILFSVLFRTIFFCYNRVMKKILTYGTFDLLHFGHVEILRRAKKCGDYLIVALSTDEFNKIKGKQSYYNYETRKKILESIRYVDLVIPEESWGQKRDDIRKYEIDTVVMGADWKGNKHFEELKDICDVVYLPRTKGISTTKIKKDLKSGMIERLLIEGNRGKSNGNEE